MIKYFDEEPQINNPLDTPSITNPEEVYTPLSRSDRARRAIREQQPGSRAITTHTGLPMREITGEDSLRSFEGMPFSSLLQDGGPHDWRAQQQSVAAKWANVAPKFVTIATTSFLDSTVGTIWGGLEALAAADGGKFVDNTWSNWMLDIQDNMQKWFPNYASTAEMDSVWHQRLGKANFWADVVVNQGFTAGTIAAMALWGGIFRAGIGAAVGAPSRGMQAYKAGRGTLGAAQSKNLSPLMQKVTSGNLTTAQLSQELVKQAQLLRITDKAAQWTSALFSSAGYARVEALGHGRELDQRLRPIIENDFNESLPQLEAQLRAEALANNPYITPEELEDYIDTRIEQEKTAKMAELDKAISSHLNTTFLADLFYLTITNNIMWGRFGSANYSVQKNLQSLGIKARDPKNIWKGFESTPLSPVQKAGRIGKQVFKNPTVQFFEESFLHINRESSGEFYGNQFDPEATKEIDGFWNNYLSKAFETFSDIDEWESGMMGFIGGFLGGVGPRVRNGKLVGVEGSGGAWEFRRAINEANNRDAAARTQVDALNKHFENPERQEMYRAAVRNQSLQRMAEDATVAGDKFTAENLFDDQFINSLLLADRMGMRQEFMESIGIDETISGETARNLLTKLRDEKGNDLAQAEDIFKGKTNQEVETLLRTQAREYRRIAERITNAKADLDLLSIQREVPEQVIEQMLYYIGSIESMDSRISKSRKDLANFPGLVDLANTIHTTKRAIVDKSSKGKAILAESLDAANNDKTVKELTNQLTAALNEVGADKRVEVTGQVDEYIGLLSRLESFTRAYEMLGTDEGMQNFLNKIEEIEQEAAEINEEAAQVDEVPNAENTTPDIQDIVAETVYTDPETGAQSTGTISVEVLDGVGKPTGENLELQVDEVAQNGNLKVRIPNTNKVGSLTIDGQLTGFEGGTKSIGKIVVEKSGKEAAAEAKNIDAKPVKTTSKKSPPQTAESVKQDKGEMALQEDYDQSRTVKFDPDPRQPFIGVDSFKRTTNSQHEFIKEVHNNPDNVEIYEPQLRFQHFVDNYDTSADTHTLVGYTYKQLLDKFGDILTDKHKSILKDTGQGVFMVLSNKEGVAIQEKSDFGDNNIIMFAFISDLKDSNKQYINKRAHSDSEIVDMKAVPKEEQSKKYAEAAKKFDEEVRAKVFESEDGVIFNITGKTSGTAKLAPDAQPVEKALTKTELQELDIVVPFEATATSNTSGESFNVTPGYAYIDFQGKILPVTRETLSTQDSDTVVELIKKVLSANSAETFKDLFNVINNYTFMVYQSKLKDYEGKNFSRFAITEKSGNYTGVHIVENKVDVTLSKESILDGTSIDRLKAFLANKFYNIQKNDAQNRNAEVKIAKIEDGEVVTEKVNYRDFLLGLEGHTPKILTKLRTQPSKDTNLQDHYTNRRALNRSLRFELANIEQAPITDTVEEKVSTPITTSKVSNEKTRTLGEFNDGDYIVHKDSGKEYEVINKSKTLPKVKLKPNKTNYQEIHDLDSGGFVLKPAEKADIKKINADTPEGVSTEGFILPDEGVSAEELAAIRKEVSDFEYNQFLAEVDAKNILDEAKAEEAAKTNDVIEQKRQQEIKKLKEARENTDDDSSVDFMTYTSDSMVGGKATERVSNYVKFKSKFSGVQIFTPGVEAMAGHDGMLEVTTNKLVRVLINPAIAGVEWHEGYHIVSRLFNSEEHNNKLYDALRAELGSKEITLTDSATRIETTVKGTELTNKQAEEYLAEQFRAYMLVGKNNYKFGKNEQVKKNFFDRIWEGIVAYIQKALGRNIDKEQTANNPEWLMSEFNRIDATTFDISTIKNLNPFTEYKVGEFNEATSANMVSGMNNIFFKAGFGAFNGAEVLQDINSFYLNLYKVVENSLKKKLEKEGAENVPGVKDLLDNFDEAMYEHHKFLRQYNIAVDPFVEARQDENRSKDNEGWFESNQINHVQVAKIPIKLLVASLDKVDAIGNTVQSNGLPQSADYNQVMSRLHTDLAGTQTWEGMVDKMASLSDKFPVYKQVMHKLKTSPANYKPNTLTEAELNLQQVFYNQFKKAYIDSQTLIYGEDGTSYMASSVASTMQGRIIDTWKNNVKYGHPATKGIFGLVNGRHKLNKNGTVVLGSDKYKLSDLNAAKLVAIKKNTPDVFRDFLAAFGINIAQDINEGVDISNMGVVSSGIFQYLSETKGDIYIEDIFDRNKTIINKELTDLAKREAFNSPDVNLNQLRNSKGETEYAIKLENYIDKIISKLNVADVSQLPEWLQPFNGTKGSFLTYGSKWIGGKNIKRVDKAILRNMGSERGDKVDFNDLKPGDHKAIKLQAVFNGLLPYIRSADRKLEYVFDIGQSDIQSLSTREYRDTLRDYLEAELVFAVALQMHPEAKRFVRDTGGLNFFKDIKGLDSLRKDLSGYENTALKDIIPAAKEMMNNHTDAINKALDTYISELREETKQSFIDDRLFEPVGDKFVSNAVGFDALSRKALDLNVEKVGKETYITDASLNKLIDMYNFNYTKGAIEQTKLITGNINTYVKGNKYELHKRTTLFTSTGAHADNSKSLIPQLNRLSKRLDGAQHTNKYNQLTVQDHKVASEFLQMYKNAIGDKADAYASATANDAAGLVFMDAYKSYHIRGKGWTTRQDKTWQYQAQVLFKEFLKEGYITEAPYREMFTEHLPSKVAPIDRYYYKGESLDVYTKDKNGNITLELVPLVQFKPISVGVIANDGLIDFGKKGLTKTAATLVLPSDFVGNKDAIKFIWNNMKVHNDFIFPESAEKGERVGSLEGTLPSLYNEDGTRIDVSKAVDEGGFILTERFWDDMADQLDIDPLGHDRATDSTQKRRLIYIDTFELGNIIDGKDTNAQDFEQYVAIYNAITNNEINKLVADLGLKEADGTYSLDNIGKFVDILTEEFKNRELPDNALEAVHEVFNATRELKLFDAIPNKRQFVNLLQGLVRARAINLKVAGDQLIQQSSTLMNTKVEKHNELLPYRLTDGTINKETGELNIVDDLSKATEILPMQVKVSAPIAWIPFIDTLQGTTFEDKMVKFNEWMRKPENKKLRTYMAIRIPGQNLNSIESAEVVEFLSPFGGPRVVVPAELVVKTGSDFDVDKLTTYFNNVKLDRKTKQPKYIEFETDRAKLWEQHKQRELNSKEAKEFLESIGIDVSTFIDSQKFQEAFERAAIQKEDPTKKTQFFNLFETSDLTLIYEELQDANIMLTEKEFATKSLEQLNSRAALENRLNEIGKKILTNPANFEALITPNDLGVIKKAAEELGVSDDAVLPAHKLLEAEYNNEVSYNQLVNKAGVGVAANNSSAHALQQRYPIRFKSRAIQIIADVFSNYTGDFILGYYKDSRDNIISNTNGSTLSGFVDAANEVEPVVGKLNLTPSTANTYAVLNRLGGEGIAPLDFISVAKFMTRPTIIKFEKLSRANETQFIRANNKGKQKLDIVKSILNSSEAYKKVGKNYKHLYEEMNDYIKVILSKASDAVKADAEARVVAKIENIKQIQDTNWKGLELYLYYTEVAKLLNMVQKVTRPDARLAKHRAQAMVEARTLERLRNSGIVDGIDAMIQDSYIAGFQNVQETSNKMFDEFHIDAVSNEFKRFIWGDGGIADYMHNPKINRPADKAADAILKLENSTLNYILHTTNIDGKAINKVYNKLLKGPNSTPALLGKIKSDLAANGENSQYKEALNNPAINEFVPMIKEYNSLRDKHHETDYIKTFNRKYTPQESNTITRGIKELMEASNPEISRLGKELFAVALMQSGVQNTPFSFFELLPSKHYYDRVMSLINEYFNTSSPVLTEQAKDSIYGNLINDTDVVPRIKTTSAKYTKIGNITHLRVENSNQNSEYEYLSVSQKVGNTDKFVLQLYKKASENNNNSYYNKVNVYGDPMRHAEYYAHNTSSIHSSNAKGIANAPTTTPQQVTPATGQQLSMFGDAPKQYPGKPEFNKLPSPTPGKKTMTYAGIGSRGTPATVLKTMTEVAKYLEGLGYTLRTGDADGADKAFRNNVTSKEVFVAKNATDTTRAIAKEIHPNWGALKTDYVRNLMARNTNQVFGKNLDTPVDFVLFYAEETSNLLRPKVGTGQAVEIARRKGIPTINMATPNWRSKLTEVLKGTTPTTQQTGQFQLSQTTDAKPDAQLNKAINNFLKTIGVETKSVDEIVSNNKIWGNKAEGAIAVAKIAEKTIEVIDDRADKLTLPEEAAHFYVEMLPTDNVLYKAMMNQITQFQVYQDTLAEYGDTYAGNELKIKKEAIGKAIAMKIAGMKLENTQQDKVASNWWRALWRHIKNMFKVSNPFQIAAKEMLNNNISRLNTDAAQAPQEDYLRKTPERLETLDDVGAIQKAQAKERRLAEQKEELQRKLPVENKETAKQNKEELSKVSETELAVQDIMRNFDTYFSDYSHWSSQEKLTFAETMNLYDIIC